jgi:putative ABC transport system ATP-binding protein
MTAMTADLKSHWLSAVRVSRHYRSGPVQIRAVDEVSLALDSGDFLAVVGASGSGKSTLLNLLAGLDTPTAGTIEVDGRALSSLDRRGRARYRGRDVGMVFQSFNLISHLTALQNVELALYFDDTPRSARRVKAEAILERLGLAGRVHHRPADLSGGEQQRVALARALVKEPRVLLADEPTGNLDEDNSSMIAELFTELNGQGLTVVLVTHDMALASRCARRVIRMQYGRVLMDGAGEGGSATP